MPSRAYVSRHEDRVKDALGALERLLAPAEVRGRGTILQDLITRAEISSEIDGYSAGGDKERVGGGDTSDPTMSQALARLKDVCSRCKDGVFMLEDGRQVPCRACGGSGRRWADPVGDAVDQVLERVGMIARSCKILDREVEKVLGAAASARGRVSSLQGDCTVCGVSVSGVGEHRLRKGMCGSDYLAWNSWKLKTVDTLDPGEMFVRFRIARLAYLKKKAEAEEAERVRMGSVYIPKHKRR